LCVIGNIDILIREIKNLDVYEIKLIKRGFLIYMTMLQATSLYLLFRLCIEENTNV